MQITKGKFNKNEYFSIFMLILSLIFYLFFACFDGEIICVDSPGYLEMNLTREPLYPMFLAFFRLLFSGVLPNHYLFFVVIIQSILAAVAAWSMTAFLSFLMISTRKQMVVSLIILVVSILYVFFAENNFRRGIAAVLLCSFGILLCSTCLDIGYNYVVRGKAVRHSGDTRFITTMAFYTAGRDDCQYIEDKDIQDLFLEIYDACDEGGYLKANAGEGWINRVSHFGDHYDRIQIDTMWPLITSYADEHCGGDDVDISRNTDIVMNTINASVIPHNAAKIAATFADNFLSGLVTTVAQIKSFLIGYTFLIYLLYMLLFFHIYQNKNHRLCLLALLTLLSIFLNVGLVSMVIFCQTRYTIYNMALFYISLLLMLHETFTNRI